MERFFVRTSRDIEEAAAQRNPQQLNIGVTGLGRSVGTTFVASSLAFYFASKGKSVTFSQCVTPSRCEKLLYDSVAMDQRFAGRGFTDVYKLLWEEKSIRNVKNMEKGVNWLLPTPWTWQNDVDLSEVQRARLIQGARGDVCIFDLAAEAEWDSFLLDMDMLLVVTDPMPAKLIRSSQRFKMLKRTELSGIESYWIVNHTNSGISRRQITGYLKNKGLLWIPEFDSSLFYADEFACRFSWENAEIRCKIMEIFTKVSQ